MVSLVCDWGGLNSAPSRHKTVLQSLNEFLGDARRCAILAAGGRRAPPRKAGEQINKVMQSPGGVSGQFHFILPLPEWRDRFGVCYN